MKVIEITNVVNSQSKRLKAKDTSQYKQEEKITS